MGEGCIFCQIASGKIKSDKVYSDENVVAFNDISPQAPHHILIVPKKHYVDIPEALEKDPTIINSLFAAVEELIKKLDLKTGYRIVVNSGKLGGQLVPHLHIHLLSGRKFSWPPG
jgi:histidine triad (HIT) family protein